MNRLITRPRSQIELDIAVTESKLNRYSEDIEKLEDYIYKEEIKLGELALQRYIRAET